MSMTDCVYLDISIYFGCHHVDVCILDKIRNAILVDGDP